MPPLRVLISGAGVAGNALAFWLSRLPYASVSVVERFPSLRATGLQIDLRGAGVDVLRRMGLEEAFRAASAPELGLAFVDGTGKTRAYFPANTSGKGAQGFTSEFEIMRGDLCRLMYDATAGNGKGQDKMEKRVRYLFGTSIERLDELADGSGGVEVRFANGITEKFDLVVGADGVGSRVRRLLLGRQANDDAGDPSFHGVGNSYIAYFTIPRPLEPGEKYVAKCYVAPGRRSILTRRHDAKTLQVYFMYRGDGDGDALAKVKRGDVEAEKAAFETIFAGAGWIADDALKAMREESTDFYCDRQGVVKIDSWSSAGGRVALLGDAAHGVSANGFGTSAAMIGAYVLAGEIAKHCGGGGGGAGEGKNDADGGDATGLAAALQDYEKQLRPHMAKMQKAVENDKSMLPSSAFGIFVMYYLVGLVAFLRLDYVAMKFFPTEKHLALPDYSDVLRI